MVHVVVERDLSPAASSGEVPQPDRDVQASLAAGGIRTHQCLMAGDGSKVISVYEAPDLEVVRRAYENAELGPVRVWTADELRDTDVGAHPDQSK